MLIDMPMKTTFSQDYRPRLWQHFAYDASKTVLRRAVRLPARIVVGHRSVYLWLSDLVSEGDRWLAEVRRFEQLPQDNQSPVSIRLGSPFVAPAKRSDE
jgi:hypothetical protein